jgi:hypothetical protein
MNQLGRLPGRKVPLGPGGMRMPWWAYVIFLALFIAGAAMVGSEASSGVGDGFAIGFSLWAGAGVVLLLFAVSPTYGHRDENIRDDA